MTFAAQTFQQAYAQAYQTAEQIAPHMERYQRLEALLSDMEALLPYVNDLSNLEFGCDLVQLLAQYGPAQQVPVPQRPEFPGMPAQGQTIQQFSLAQVRPEDRWRVADQMERAGMFQGKTLIG